jgi:hypothetical protein
MDPRSSGCRITRIYGLPAGFGVVAVDDFLLDPTPVGHVEAFRLGPFADGPVLVTVGRPSSTVDERFAAAVLRSAASCSPGRSAV